MNVKGPAAESRPTAKLSSSLLDMKFMRRSATENGSEAEPAAGSRLPSERTSSADAWTLRGAQTVHKTKPKQSLGYADMQFNSTYSGRLQWKNGKRKEVEDEEEPEPVIEEELKKKKPTKNVKKRKSTSSLKGHAKKSSKH